MPSAAYPPHVHSSPTSKAFRAALKSAMIDLSEQDLAVVRILLAKHLPGCKVYAFGPHIRGTAKPCSDLDLAIEAHGSIPPEQLESQREAFSESNLPILVDLVDLHTVSASFRSRIEESRQEI